MLLLLSAVILYGLSGVLLVALGRAACQPRRWRIEDQGRKIPGVAR